MTSRTNAPDKVGAVHGRRRDDLVAGGEFDGEHDERDEQDHRQHRLDPVDHLVSEEPDRALHAEHDENSTPERNAEQHGKRLSAEQPDQRIPGDRRQPLQRTGKHHPGAERHP